MKVAYVCSPYRSETIHGVVENIRKAEKVALKYWKLGYAVICPHKNTALLDGAMPDDRFLAGGLELLRRSDVVIINGWTAGCRAEIELAVELGMEIIYEDM